MKTRHVRIGIAVGLVLLLAVGLLAGGSLWGRSYYHHGPGMMWDDGLYGGSVTPVARSAARSSSACARPWAREADTMMGLGMGTGLFGLVLMLLFWGGLIALALWLVRSLFPQALRSPERAAYREANAREILDRRFARGEIDRDEYNRMRETLSR